MASSFLRQILIGSFITHIFIINRLSTYSTARYGTIVLTGWSGVV